VKRFYKQAMVTEDKQGFGVALDGRPVRTPAKHALAVPTHSLAAAIAAEWQAQGERVDPRALPLTRLASIARDLVAPRRSAVVAEIVKYAGTDLVCYRAEEPAALRDRQHAAWQPHIDWAAQRFGAPLGVTSGVLPPTFPKMLRPNPPLPRPPPRPLPAPAAGALPFPFARPAAAAA